MDRREFLRCAACAGAALVLPTPIRAFTRAPAPVVLGGPRRAAAKRTLVLLHLEGGNDGLSTVVPYADPIYASLRPTLARRGNEVIPLDGRVGLHSNLTGLKTLFDQGQLAVVLGVGYPKPDFSHFRATEIWQSAEPDRTPSQGWIGRWMDATPKHVPVRALSLGNEPPLVLASQSTASLTVQSFNRFKLPESMNDIESVYAAGATAGGATARAADAGTAAIRAARKLAALEPGKFNLGGGPLGNTMAKVAAIIAADIDVEVITCAFTGFDTHAGQRSTHDQLMGQLGRVFAAFQADLKTRGLDDRVLTVVYSEFGRRPQENASGGTDHGSAAPVFVIGRGVRKGIYGEQPPLKDLDSGNLRFSVDFRRIYASVLRDWLGQAPGPVVGAFDPLPLLA